MLIAHTSPPFRRLARSSPIGLDRVAGAGTILAAIRLTPLAIAEAAFIARSDRGSGAQVRRLIDATNDPLESLIAIGAVHALGAADDPAASEALAELIRTGRGSLPAHAAWTAERRAPEPTLFLALSAALTEGGMTGMHAQAALLRWARLEPDVVLTELRRQLGRRGDAAARRALVETLGLVQRPEAHHDLAAIAADPTEAVTVRLAAIAAFDARPTTPLPSPIAALASSNDERLAAATRLALDGVPTQTGQQPIRRGQVVAQIHLGSTLDAELSRAGMGSTGGIATLLVKLGAALASTPGIDRVVSIGRATPAEALAAGDGVEGHLFVPAPLEPEAGMAFSDEWPARIAAERGLRRALRHQRPDVMHLRMADVGTLAAANVAGSLDIPTVFTLAPDPHAAIAQREAAGELDRAGFASADATEQLWYRVNLVDRLARAAAHVVLFPRDDLANDMRELVGIDIGATPRRFSVVAEGVDTAAIRLAVSIRAGQRPAAESAAVADLRTWVSSLPCDRRGLPIVLSVGRLHELKGMARLIEAFAADSSLGRRANLVIVGGDMDEPSPTESAELARIDAILADQPDLSRSILLLGRRPNGEVADLLAVTRHGMAGLVGTNGAYACASHKEEFGLAIVEALAAGLPVVAPRVGGPRTYVEDGVIGRLVDTGDAAAIARGVHEALDLAPLRGRAEYAARSIATRYDISTMAGRLTAIYERVSARRAQRLAS